jgi:hypothetical protein
METFFIPTENDFKSWVREAVKESMREILMQQSEASLGEEPLLSRKEIAGRLNISLVTLRDWVKHGLPSHKQRGKVYFLYSEVIGHIKSSESQSRKQALAILPVCEKGVFRKLAGRSNE